MTVKTMGSALADRADGLRHDMERSARRMEKSVEKSARKARRKTRKSMRHHPMRWGAAGLASLAAMGAATAAMLRRRKTAH